MDNARISSELILVSRLLSVPRVGASKYYHVTQTGNVGKIKSNGIIPFQTSNWIKGTGERYGNGEIFVFEKLKDAIRWGGKMDWAQNTEMGTGKISVVEIKDTSDWDIDSSDPLGHAMSDGKWFKRMKAVISDDIGKSFVVTMDKIKKVAL